MAAIQATLQAAIDQAYLKVLADLGDLEREIQSGGADGRPWPPEVVRASTTLVETLEEESPYTDEIEAEAPPVEDSIMAGEVASPKAKVVEDEEALPGLPELGSHELSISLNGAQEIEQEEDHANIGGDEVREKILESLQQVIELNGHGDAFAANGKTTPDEEQMSPYPSLENMATNGNGANGNGQVANLDIYEGDWNS